MAQLDAAAWLSCEEHRHPVAVCGFELRIGVDVDDVERRARGRGERPHGGEHFIAEVTVGARQESELWRAGPLGSRARITHSSPSLRPARRPQQIPTLLLSAATLA